MTALPNHQAATLVRYGRRLFDVAARTFRANPTAEADAVLRSAAEALRHASACYAGASRDYFVTAARALNEAAGSMNRLLAGHGAPAFSFVAQATRTDA